MKTKIIYVFFVIFIIPISIILVECKKYPKNYLLIDSPEKTLTRGAGNPWKLVHYSVDDVDSTFAGFLNVYKNEGLVLPVTLNSPNDQAYYCLDIIFGYWEFTNKKKRIHFKYSNDNYRQDSYTNINYVNQRNIFIKSGQGWNIDKLNKSEFRIISEYNNKKYEIHFK